MINIGLMAFWLVWWISCSSFWDSPPPWLSFCVRPTLPALSYIYFSCWRLPSWSVDLNLKSTFPLNINSSKFGTTSWSVGYWGYRRRHSQTIRFIVLSSLTSSILITVSKNQWPIKFYLVIESEEWSQSTRNTLDLCPLFSVNSTINCLNVNSDAFHLEYTPYSRDT